MPGPGWPSESTSAFQGLGLPAGCSYNSTAGRAFERYARWVGGDPRSHRGKANDFHLAGAKSDFMPVSTGESMHGPFKVTYWFSGFSSSRSPESPLIFIVRFCGNSLSQDWNLGLRSPCVGLGPLTPSRGPLQPCSPSRFSISSGVCRTSLLHVSSPPNGLNVYLFLYSIFLNILQSFSIQDATFSLLIT